MKRIFVATGLMGQLQEKNKQSSQAAANFFESLKKLGIFDFFLVIPPGNISLIDHKPSFRIVQFVNRLYLRSKIERHLGVILANFRLFRTINKINPREIWTYNISKTNIVFHLLLALTGKRSNLILADRYFHDSNKILKFLESYIVKRQTGYILLREAYLKLPIKTNYVILQGIIKSSPLKIMRAEGISGVTNILFSGLLSQRNGIMLFLEMVRKFQNDDRVCFHVCGINAENISFDEFRPYQNFTYHGIVSYDEYLRLLSEADICPSFRDPNVLENTYEFPSKMFEYYSAGKIILSTMKYVGISSELIITCDFEINSVTHSLNEILDNYEFYLEKDIDYTLYNRYNLDAWRANILSIEDFTRANSRI